MIREVEIRKRLNAAIDRAALGSDREKVARYTVGLLVPEVEKLIRQALREAKSKDRKGD